MAYTTARDAQLPLRMPQDMKTRLQQEAKAAGRSVNAEVIYRISKTFGDEFELTTAQDQAPSTLESMAEDIRALREIAERMMTLKTL